MKGYRLRIIRDIALCICLGSAPVTALSQVDTNSLRLHGARSEGGMLVPSSRLMQEGSWDLSLTFGHEDGLLRTHVPTGQIRGGSRSRELTWVDGRDLLYLQFAASPVDRLETTLGVPLLLGQTSSSGDALPSVQTGSTAFGDMRVGLRYALLGTETHPWSWALQGGLLLPTGEPDFGIGDENTRADLATSFGYRGGERWAAHVHVGHQMGQRSVIGDQLLGDTAFASLLLQTRYPIGTDALQWSLETVVRRVLSSPPAGVEPERNSLEALAGARWLMDSIYVDVGGGMAALAHGTTPGWRLLASLGTHGSWARPSTSSHPSVAAIDDAVVAPPTEPAPPPETTAVAEPQVPTCGGPDGPPCVEPAPEPTPDPRALWRVHEVEQRVVFFDVGRADLDSTSENLLRSIALIVLETDGRILVTGYADDRGARARNEELSLRRAQVVRDALVAAGVDENRLLVAGEGDRSPAAAATEFGRSINRRVTFTWIGTPAP